MSDMKCKLKIYRTLLPINILNKKEYDCPGNLPVVESYYLYKGELCPGQVT